MVVPLNSSSSPSPSSRSTRMRNFKNAISTLGVNHFSFSSDISSKAAKNGDRIVYHRSDCGYPKFRWYRDGGDREGSFCESNPYISRLRAPMTDKVIFPACEQGLSAADIIWFGNRNYDDPNFIIDTVRNKMSNTKGIDWNWNEGDLLEFISYANKKNDFKDKYICNSSGFSLNPDYRSEFGN